MLSDTLKVLVCIYVVNPALLAHRHCMPDWKAVKQMYTTGALYAVASTIGAAFIFPGVSNIDGGTSLSAPPFLSGLGPIFLIWLVAPTLTLMLVILLFLLIRTCLMRGEDPFHKVLWVSLGNPC